MKNVEVDHNSIEESHEAIYGKSVQEMKLVPAKRVYNEIFLIVRYEYKDNGFL